MSDWEIQTYRIYKKQAREASFMASVASGCGWYDLANELYRFEGYLNLRGTEYLELEKLESNEIPSPPI